MSDQPEPRPSSVLAVALSAAAVGLLAWLHLVTFSDRLLPLTYALALLVCLWHRDRRILWAMTLGLAGVAWVKVYLVLEPDPLWSQGGLLLVRLVNLVAVAATLHLWLRAASRLEARNRALEEARAELASQNAALAARDAEISEQNGELQEQAEELEQQKDELQRQAEELEVQAEGLRALHDDTARREQALEALFSFRRTVKEPEDGPSWDGIPAVALTAFGPRIDLALVLREERGQLTALAECREGGACSLEGFQPERSLGRLLMAEGRTGFLADLHQRPDLSFPAPRNGVRLGSVLAVPLRCEGGIWGALECYAREPGEWTAGDFALAEWLAAQLGLVFDLARLHQENRDRRREAEEAAARRTRFLAAVSHDIRTPANAISLTAEVLRRGSSGALPPERVAELAETLQRTSRSLVDLVGDVVDLTRIESAGVEIHESVFPLGDALREAAGPAGIEAARKKVALQVTLTGPEVRLRADRVKLQRILANLLNNAVKFTDRGGRVLAGFALGPDGTGILSIQDTGVGLSPEQLPHIFDEFYQVENQERSRSKGAGLGLAICKRLADAMGLGLSVASEPGRGATFALAIPADRIAMGTEDGPSGKDGSLRRLAGRDVLLVEDHDATRDALRALLEQEGARLRVAANGPEALEALQQAVPDVLLLDLMLPGMDGRDVLKFMNERRLRPGCCLALSADTTRARREETLGLGVDGLLCKPVQIEVLVGVLKAVLEDPARA